ncbi:MAG: ABC transporter substrate-binding protein [Xanthobacteraceae bacterium]
MRLAVATTMLIALGTAAQAADVIKLGNLTQLSGALAAPGSETKRGIDLALEELGNKLGGVPVRYYPVDDKSNPAEAINGASKLIDDIKVDFVTGLGASNTLIPVFKSFVDANIFVVGALAGPRQFAGNECHPNGFFVSFTNDDWPAAAGQYMTNQGYKRVFFLGADYQAGKEHIESAMRFFKGQAIGPAYTPLPQMDFAPEIARIRAEKPDAVFSFLVGAGGIAFSKQYSQGGLMGQIPFVTEDPAANPLTFPAQGDAALGIVMASNWHMGLDNAANKKFLAGFRAKYNRDPATFAALGYDAVKAIDAAVRGVNGKIEDKDALRSAMRKADFASVRGKFKFNNNQFPIQDLFMMEVAKDDKGGLTSKLKEVAIKDWQDPLHAECSMKW